MTALVRLRDLCIDAVDPQRVGEFWATLLGREPIDAGSGDGLTPDVVLPEAPGSPGPAIRVHGVAEPVTGPVRLRLEVDLVDGRGMADLLALGATVVSTPRDVPCWVLADPEDNEFRVFLPGSLVGNDAEVEVPVVDVELPD